MEKLIWFYNQETTPNCFVLQFIGTTNYKTAYLLWISKVDFYTNSKLFYPISLILLIEVYKQLEIDGVLAPMIWCLECLRSG